MNIKYSMGVLIVTIHFIIGVLLGLFLIYTDNIYYIMFMIFGLFLLMSHWYFLNDCLLIGFENYLMDKKNKYSDFTKFQTINLFGRNYYIFDHVLYSTYFYSTFILFNIAFFKLAYILYKKENKK
jgi:hypothetical protein